MSAIYQPGDIVYFKNVMFKDKDGKMRIDTRINGHPFLILNRVKDFGKYAICLMISSVDRSEKGINQYILNGIMKRVSYVRLDKAYTIKVDCVIPPVAHLPEKMLSKIEEIVFSN